MRMAPTRMQRARIISIESIPPGETDKSPNLLQKY